MDTDFLSMAELQTVLLLKQPVDQPRLLALKALAEKYPYFQWVQYAYLYSLAQSYPQLLPQEVENHIVFIRDKTTLYGYLKGNLTVAKDAFLEKAGKASSFHQAIDHFIAICEHLTPQDTGFTVDITPSIRPNDELATETLAQVYASQNMYKKAISVYRKLILIYPEKSSYFATQIQNLEQELI